MESFRNVMSLHAEMEETSEDEVINVIEKLEGILNDASNIISENEEFVEAQANAVMLKCWLEHWDVFDAEMMRTYKNCFTGGLTHLTQPSATVAGFLLP